MARVGRAWLLLLAISVRLRSWGPGGGGTCARRWGPRPLLPALVGQAGRSPQVPGWKRACWAGRDPVAVGGRRRGGPCAFLTERSRAQGLEGAALDACAAGTTLRGCKSRGSRRLGRDPGGLGGAPSPGSGPYTCVSAGWYGGALYLHCRKPRFRATSLSVFTLSSRGFPP